MKQYEYKVEQPPVTGFESRAHREIYLNEMGRFGWELIQSDDKEWHVWKRELPTLVYCS